MAYTQTQITAVIAAYYLWHSRCGVRTILNIGVSSAPEVWIWHWLLPDVKLVGIDPKRRRGLWGGDYVRAIASDGVKPFVGFCFQCRSVHCLEPKDHAERIRNLKAVTIDEVAAKYPAPYFLWMDIEGGELAALAGATQTLKQTPWLNVEVSDWTPGDGSRLHEYLVSLGYKAMYDHRPRTEDRLYRHLRWNPQKQSL